MTRISTLLFLMDYSEGDSEIIDVDEFLDPFGKCSIELERTFKNIDFSPPEDIIANILMKV